jgi:chorismate dehydratase
MPYLNSEVFYRELDPTSCDLVTLRPRAMAAAVERGEINGGPLPVAEIFRLGDTVREVGDLGVANFGPALSVLLLSEVPAEQLDGKKIAVTEDTATSVQLLRVLSADHWQIVPELVPMEEPATARLVIGDEANRLRKQGESPFVYDLSEEWYKLTRLPFVFAVWVLRTDVPQEQFDAFEKALTDSYCEGRQMVKEIAAERANEYITEDEAAAYVRNFSYTIGDMERRGMEEFRRRLNLLPEWRPPAPAVATSSS